MPDEQLNLNKSPYRIGKNLYHDTVGGCSFQKIYSGNDHCGYVIRMANGDTHLESLDGEVIEISNNNNEEQSND